MQTDFQITIIVTNSLKKTEYSGKDLVEIH